MVTKVNGGTSSGGGRWYFTHVYRHFHKCGYDISSSYLYKQYLNGNVPFDYDENGKRFSVQASITTITRSTNLLVDWERISEFSGISDRQLRNYNANPRYSEGFPVFKIFGRKVAITSSVNAFKKIHGLPLRKRASEE